MDGAVPAEPGHRAGVGVAVGFVAPSGTEITLEFTEIAPALEGLEVRCRGASEAEIDEVAELSGDEALGRFFDRYFIEWDLVDAKKKSIEPSVEGVAKLEPWIGKAILRAWIRGCYEIPTPLDESSSGGGT